MKQREAMQEILDCILENMQFIQHESIKIRMHRLKDLIFDEIMHHDDITSNQESKSNE